MAFIFRGEVFVTSVEGGVTKRVTNTPEQERGVSFSPDGKAMLWVSDRDGLKSAAQSGAAQSDVYAMFFTQDAWDRYRLTKEEFALVKEAEDTKDKEKADAAKDKKDAAKDKDAKPEDVVIDFDGLSIRKARLTIHSSSLGDALVSKEAETLYYLARFERGMNLWSTNLRTRETKMLLSLNANGGRLEWDKEQKNIFLLADGGISKIDPGSAKRDTVGINGEMVLNVAAERQHMFEHVWRRTRETFYTAGYHGVDWDGLKPVYAKYLPHVGNNYEFAEVLSEMLGELNVSHSGASYSSSNPSDDATAALGIIYDQSYRGTGVKVDEVIKNGPLDKTGMNVRPGMIIEAIDGETVTPDKDLAQYLNRKAGKNVLVVVADGDKRTDLVVKPITLAEESRLLYARWVRRNQAEVDRLSDGHCYAFTVKALGLGKLVGMPTPGTCTFAGWESLPESGMRWGVPPVGVKDTATGKYLENQQTEPDIKVMNEYAVVAKGKDQQLEAAVAQLLKEIR